MKRRPASHAGSRTLFCHEGAPVLGLPHAIPRHGTDVSFPLRYGPRVFHCGPLVHHETVGRTVALDLVHAIGVDRGGSIERYRNLKDDMVAAAVPSRTHHAAHRMVRSLGPLHLGGEVRADDDILEAGLRLIVVYAGDVTNHPIFKINAKDFENPYIFVLKDAVVVMDRVCVAARNMMKFEAFKPTKAKVFGARSGFEMPFDFAGIAWCSDVFVNAKGNLVLVGASTEYQFGVRDDVLAAIPFEANNLFEHMPYGWKSAKEILLDEQALREKFEK